MTPNHPEPNLKKEECSRKIKLFGFAVFCITSMGLWVTYLFSDSVKSKSIQFDDEDYKSNETISFRLQQGNTFRREIAMKYFSQSNQRPISKFRCTGSENDIQAWKDRLCVFYNLCYDTNTKRFNYFQEANSKPKPIFYDSKRGMLFNFNEKNKDAKFVSLAPEGDSPWGPLMSTSEYPLKNATRLHQLHSLIKTRFADSNIAHGLWEDLGSVSYSMERMKIFDDELVIMHAGKIPNTALLELYKKNIIPALTKSPMLNIDDYIASFKSKYVCFDNLIVGGQLSVFPLPRIKENHGREALFYNWRSKILEYNGFDPNYIPKKHHIILTNKSHSIWTKPGYNRHRAIVNLKEVAMFLQATYPKISSEVVEWHTLSFPKQIEKLLNTSILITPCGGVSMLIPLLPHGAHAIVMDFYVSEALHGFRPGESGSMEGAFLNHISHVRKQYYQVYGPSDYEFDFPGTKDTREQASIVINLERLKQLIDKSLREMES